MDESNKRNKKNENFYAISDIVKMNTFFLKHYNIFLYKTMIMITNIS